MKEFAFEVGLIARVRVRAPDEASARRAVPSVIGAPGAQDIALANQGIDVLLPGAMVTAVDFIPDKKVKRVRSCTGATATKEYPTPTTLFLT